MSVISFVVGNQSQDFSPIRGTIEFYDNLPISEIISNPSNCPTAYNETSSASDELLETTGSSRIVCLMNIPSFMIPTGIIQYFSAYLPEILSIRIVKYYDSDVSMLEGSQDQLHINANTSTCYMGLFLITTSDIASSLIRDFHGQTLTSLELTLCIMAPVKALTYGTPISSRSASPFRAENPYITPGQTSSKSIDITSSYSIGSMGKSHKEASSPASKASAFLSGNTTLDQTLSDDGSVCVLCLEPISSEWPKSFTTFCNHNFHVDCIMKLESPQCPVCRFQHDAESATFSACCICGFSGEGSELHTNHAREDRDLWVCLVCGFIGCGNTKGSHIRIHYESELHTYAINTDSGRVWDFAGDGYVHRLIINRPDSLESEDTFNTNDNFDGASNHSRVLGQIEGSRSVHRPSPIKVVEVNNPRYQSHERSRVAPLSSREEDLLIGQKLETIAYRYNQILKWQLEQNRELYEQRLFRLRNFAAQEGSIRMPNEKAGKSSWAQCVIHSLTQEKSKLSRQCDHAMARLKASEHEVGDLLQLNQSLLANKPDWQGRIATAKAKLVQAEKEYRETIPKYEKEVEMLMECLDTGSGASVGGASQK